MNPITHPNAYNTVRLDGKLWIGKAEIDGASNIFKWEKVAGQGTEGATSKYSGTDLPDFTLRFLLWESRHFDAFDRDFRPLFQPPPKGQKPKAREIDFPELVKLKIRRVVVRTVGQLEVVDQTGLYAYPVEMSQFSPPKPVQVIKATAGATGADDPSQPLSANQAMIKELTKQMKEEAAK